MFDTRVYRILLNVFIISLISSCYSQQITLQDINEYAAYIGKSNDQIISSLNDHDWEIENLADVTILSSSVENSDFKYILNRDSAILLRVILSDRNNSKRLEENLNKKYKSVAEKSDFSIFPFINFDSYNLIGTWITKDFSYTLFEDNNERIILHIVRESFQ